MKLLKGLKMKGNFYQFLISDNIIILLILYHKDISWHSPEKRHKTSNLRLFLLRTSEQIILSSPLDISHKSTRFSRFMLTPARREQISETFSWLLPLSVLIPDSSLPSECSRTFSNQAMAMLLTSKALSRSSPTKS